MSRHLVRESSSTSDESHDKHDAAASTASGRSASGVTPGRLLAGLVLLAALTTASATGTASSGINPRRRDEFAESSTADVERDPEVLKQVKEMFEQGAAEFFADGMYSHFSRSLMAILTRYGRAALKAIAEYVFSGSGRADVVSEALRWLADFNDPGTLPQRWAILQHTLKSHSPRVRDGAILGFAALDDARARALLLEAQNSEPVPELRRLIQQVVDQLNATHGATPAER